MHTLEAVLHLWLPVMVAIVWTKTLGPRLSGKWKGGERFAVCHHAKRSESRVAQPDSKFSRVRWTVIYALQSLLFYAILAALLVLLLIYFQICTSVSNKSTNQMQQFLKFITWRLLVCTAQRVPDVLTSIIRSSTAAVAASDFTVGAWW
jgi:hypothetical protein